MTGTWPTGWQVGDLEVAAEFKKGIGALSDTTLGGSAASVDITSISSGYAHLIVVAYLRSDSASGNVNMLARFNNDSGANYDYQVLRGQAAAVSSAEAFAQTSALIGIIPANTAGSNLFNAQVLFIPHYAGTSNNKIALSMSAMKQGTSTTNMIADLTAFAWRSSAAINRITLTPGGNLVAGSRVTLFGLGA